MKIRQLAPKKLQELPLYKDQELGDIVQAGMLIAYLKRRGHFDLAENIKGELMKQK